MRNGRRRRNISVVICVLSVGTLLMVIALEKSSPNVPGNWFGWVIASIFGAIFSASAFLYFQFHVWQLRRLLQGDRRLAQWRVTPAEWQQFARDEKVRTEAFRQNDIKTRTRHLENGVEIIVSEVALLVDDDFYHLANMRHLQWIPDPLPCLEYNMVTSGKNGSVRWNIRFPVTAGAEPQARKIWDYVFRPLPPGLMERRWRRLRISRVLGLVVAVACVPLLQYGYLNHTNPELQSRAGWSIVIGLVGFPVGLFVSVLTHFVLRSEMRALEKAKGEVVVPGNQA